MERTLLAVESRPSGWWITLCGKPVDAREDKRAAIDAATGLARIRHQATGEPTGVAVPMYGNEALLVGLHG